jgi:ClpP class serine protease
VPRLHPSSYRLTPALVADHVGAGVLCFADEGIGRRYRLHARRPDASFNRRPTRLDDGAVGWESDLPSGANHRVLPVTPVTPALVRVDISGGIEQRAGYYDQPNGCKGWSDGHDAICERLCAAFEEGDVLLVVDSPGGAAAGLQQAVERCLAIKTKRARRVTVWADEMIGSAAMWWSLAVGDELFLPPAGQVGSIGARGDHRSVAGYLAKEGVEVTYFTWPDDGKVAFAPEKPLSQEGDRRGRRDVTIAGEAFAAAVAGSLVGKRYGLTVDAVAALHADMLTGQAAVRAGLGDGVSTFDEVVTYALGLAEKSSNSNTRGTAKIVGAKTGAQKERAMGLRAEEEEEDAGREIPTKCGHCGVENEDNAKFCKGCGKTMATKRMEDEDEEDDEEEERADHDDDDDDDDPPSSKPQHHPPPPERMARADAAYEELAGVRAGSSVPVIKGALAGLVGLARHVMTAFELSDPERAGAAFDLAFRDAAKVPDLKRKLRDQERRAKLDLGMKIVDLGIEGYLRDDVLEDVLEGDQRVGVRLNREHREMSFAALDEKYKRLSKRSPKRRGTPFEPDQTRARQAAKNGGRTDAERIEDAKQDPIVQKLWKQQGGGDARLTALAQQFVAAQASNGMSAQGGAK